MAMGGIRGKPSKHRGYSATQVESLTGMYDVGTAQLLQSPQGHGERIALRGRYSAALYDASGAVKWRDIADNIVSIVGRNLLFDAALAGSNYVSRGYVGVIGSNGYLNGPQLTDRMGAHPGWTEALFTGNRIAPVWIAADNASKATQTMSFSISGVGTMKGLFLVMSTQGTSDASATPGIETGVLFSAGLFSNGDKGPTIAGERLDVTYAVGISG